MFGYFGNSIPEASRWPRKYGIPTVRWRYERPQRTFEYQPQTPSVRDQWPHTATEKPGYPKSKNEQKIQYIFPSVPTVRTQIHVVKK